MLVHCQLDLAGACQSRLTWVGTEARAAKFAGAESGAEYRTICIIF